MLALSYVDQDVLWHEFTKFGPARGSRNSSNVRRERFKTHKGHKKGGLNMVEPQMPCESATVEVAFGIFWQERWKHVVLRSKTST